MNSQDIKKCKIITGKSAGIFENKNSPIKLFSTNLKSIEELAQSAIEGYDKVCFIGSSCMYPDKGSALIEEDLGTGAVYPTNALFSYTKLLAWQFCATVSEHLGAQYFIAIPSDIFGDPNDTHFVAQIMRKFHKAKIADEPKVTLFGTGTAVRHPIFDRDYEIVLDMLMDCYESTKPINIATPVSYAKKVSSIAQDIKDVVGYKGDVVWDASYSDGQKFKVLNNDRLTANLPGLKFTPWLESLEQSYARMLNEN